MTHGSDASHATYPTPPPAGARNLLGRSVTRIEDLPLVTGNGRYAGDINFPHQLHMRVVRATRAHGRIVSIDTTAARALPGVAAVWTNANIADLSPIDFRADKSSEALKPFRQPALARGRVRYIGDPVAAVLAEHPYLSQAPAQPAQLQTQPLPSLPPPSHPTA